MFDLATARQTPLQQSDEYARMLALFGTETSRRDGYLALHRRVDGVPVTMIPRFARPAGPSLMAALPRGLTILSPDTPQPDLRALGARRLYPGATQAVLDLTGTPDQMRAAMHGKWRNRLRHAERQELRVSISALPSERAHPVVVAEAKQARAQGYRNWPPALTLAWARANPGLSLLLEAYEGRTLVASMLFLRHGVSATYHIGQISDRGRKLSAHNLLLWRAMLALSDQGVQQLDLGLIHDRTPGLTRFKLESGARPRQLGGTWLYWRWSRAGPDDG